MINRHDPDPITRIAINRARADVRHEIPGQCHNMITHMILLGNLARWGRDLPMRSWTYEEAVGNQHGYRLP